MATFAHLTSFNLTCMETINYTCCNEDCEHRFPVNVHPLIPAKTYGPPEHCHPEEGGEIEPAECPECAHPVDKEYAVEVAAGNADDRMTAQYYALRDRAKDRF